MRQSRRSFLRGLGLGTTALALPALSARGLEAALAEPWLDAAATPPDALRLDSNENPIGPSRAVLDAIRAEFAEAGRYPYYSEGPVAERLADALHLPADHLLMGCGSGEILRIAVDAFTTADRGVVTAAPTYESPAGRARVLGVPLEAPRVDRSLRLDLDAMCDQAARGGLLFLCNPNNPTGTLHSGRDLRAAVTRALAASPDLAVLVDEAYHEYVEDPAYESMVPLALTEPRVVVSRTFSKIHGLAGLRLGYAIGQPATLARMRRHRLANSVNVLAAAAGVASLGVAGQVERERARNREVRDYTLRVVQRAGYDPVPSHANFILFDIGRNVAAVREACRERKVLVGRPFAPLDTHLRVSIGTMDEMRRGLPIILEVLG